MKKVLDLLKKHEVWRKQCLNMIASENVTSPAVAKAFISDLHGRYGEGLPGKRFYQGLVYLDSMEIELSEAFKAHFKANFCDVRPISGAVANLAVFAGLGQRGDTILTLGLAGGSHISHEKIGAAGLVGFNVEHMDINPDGSINISRAKAKIEKLLPRFLVLGGSVILFPQPIRELKEICKHTGTKIIYDAAHVFGFVFSGLFQNPLLEGADVLVASTHKTFPGPQGGIIIGNLTEEEKKGIQRKIFPGILSSHHLHRLPALSVAFSEMQKNGKKYGQQIIKNSQALAKELSVLGFNVLYKEKGFTRSHQILVDVGDGTKAAKFLEDCNIIVNKNIIPGDESAMYPRGLRIGTQELTRYGMKEREMKQIAKFFKKALLDEEAAPKIKKQVILFRKKFQKIKI